MSEVSTLARKTTNGAGDRDIDDRIIIGGAFELASTMPDVEFVMSPCFGRGHLIALTGHAGDGKSTTASTAVIHFALNRPLGVLVPESEGLAYYISAEDAQGFKLRVLAEAAVLRLAPSQRADVDSRLRWVQILDVLTPALIAAQIEKDAAGESIDLIFVDTGVALFRGEDENSNAELQAFATECRKWFTTLPGTPCVVLLWHPAKGANSDNLVPRGGSALIGALDANLTISRSDDRVTLSYTKLRGPHFDPIEFVLQPVPLELHNGKIWHVPVARALSGDKIDEANAALKRKHEAVLLAMEVDGDPLSIRRISEIAFGSDKKVATVTRCLHALAATRPALVTKDALTDSYVPTPAGRKRAAAARVARATEYRNATDPE